MSGPDPLVRDCRVEGLDALESALPSAGAHAQQLANAEAGRRTFLVGWDETHPLGVAVIRWAGVEGTVRDLGEVVPEIGSLLVVARLREAGVGTALVNAAESRISVRGFDRAAILVAERSGRAASLYDRLGYSDSGLRRVRRDEPGVEDDGVATDRVLARRLGAVGA